MWVATFSVTATRVDLTKDRSMPDSPPASTRTEAAAGRRCPPSGRPLPLGGSAGMR